MLSHDLSPRKVIHLVELCKHREVTVSVSTDEEENALYLVINSRLCVCVIDVCIGVQPDASMCCVYVGVCPYTQ